MHQNKPILAVYVYGMVLLVASCTSVYKQAPKQTFFSCLCLWGGAFTRILYFDVQTSTKTKISLVVYEYVMVLLLASCTSMYKQALKQAYLKLCMFMGWCFYSHLVLWCTNRHQTNLFSRGLVVYLCGVAFSQSLYFGVQTGTK